MKLYIACLASYNNGILHGAWIDADADEDAMQEEIATMLRASKFPNVVIACPLCEGDGETTFHNSENGDTRRMTCPTCQGKGEVPSAEEWAIHDYEDIPDLGEYPSLTQIASYVELVDRFGHINDDRVFQVVEDCSGDIDQAREMLDDRYIGTYDSFREYAEEYADDIILSDIPEEVARYFDYESFARDLGMEMHTVEVTGGVMVFHAG